MSMLEKLADSLKSGKKVSLKHSLLIASGIEDTWQGNSYFEKFYRIYDRFSSFAKARYGSNADIVKRAMALSEYLTSPVNYQDNKILFNEVIDARLSMNSLVGHGNCVGLTSLYNSLAEEDGIITGLVRARDHVLTRVIVGKSEYFIENTSANGFGVKIEYPARRSPNHDLISEILMMRPFIGRREAIVAIDLAKALSPEMSLVYFNSASYLFSQKMNNEAMEDLDKAIETDPSNPSFYKARSYARKALGDLRGWKEDFRKYNELRNLKIL